MDLQKCMKRKCKECKEYNNCFCENCPIHKSKQICEYYKNNNLCIKEVDNCFIL